VHRGSQVSLGYWNNSEETAHRFRDCPALPPSNKDQRVYYSGDIVRIDEDGVLWFVRRSDWMVKSGGFRFNLEEVEAYLMQSGLLEQAAVIPVEDESMGQVVHAAVVARRGTTFSLTDLERYCWKTLPSYMIPREFHVWDDALPLLPNGKLDRVALREHAAMPARDRARNLETSAVRTPC
jgi:acyl-CoA synthetase (AMP-forming)/AMP-acid ligase II